MWEVNRSRSRRRRCSRNLTPCTSYDVLARRKHTELLQGVLRALEEYGIPVDHVGGELPQLIGCGNCSHVPAGTSIGAFIGGLYAREGDIISSSGMAKQFSARMGNIWRMLSDVTYPIVAYTTVRSQLWFVPHTS